jgi:hypothetical protein
LKKIYKIFCLIIVVISFATVSNAEDTVYDRLVDIPVPDNSTGYADSTITEKQQEIEKYEQKEEKEQNMKKYCKIIIPIVALVIVAIIVNIVWKKKDTYKNQEYTNSSLTEQGIVDEKIVDEKKENVIENDNPEEIESIKNEINSTADSNIYYVTEETDGRKILQIKPKVQFQVDLAGIMKNSKPEEKEIESLNKKAPNKTGIWISEQSRDKFIDLLNKNNIDNLSIKKDGYLKVDKTSENEIAKNLEKMIKSDKLYIINITGVAYERDYISGEIVEYPFEDMDPEQVVEFYENGNKKILEITTNKKQKLLDKEILEEITLY